MPQTQTDAALEIIERVQPHWTKIPSDIRSYIEESLRFMDSQEFMFTRITLAAEYKSLPSGQRDRICGSIRRARTIQSTLSDILDFGPIKFGMWCFKVANPLSFLLSPVRDKVTEFIETPTRKAIKDLQDFPNSAPTWKALAASAWGGMTSRVIVMVGTILVGFADDPFELSNVANELDQISSFDLSSVAEALRGIDETMEALADTASSIPGATWDAVVREVWS